MFETSVEVYYKDFQNLIEYAEGASPQDNGNTNYDSQLVYGDGYSYGAEFFVKKVVGKVNGWVGYTWSRTNRKFPDISNGKEFPSRWDRRHDLSVVISYDVNKRIHFAEWLSHDPLSQVGSCSYALWKNIQDPKRSCHR